MTAGRAIAAALLLATSAFAQAKDDSLRVIFFDVGQGDAALIRTPDGKNILIDAGPSGDRIVAHLAALNITTVDLVIASHNHADHIGGMAAVFGAVTVREYMDNGLPALTNAYRRTVGAIENQEGLTVRAAEARTFRVGKAALRVLAPPHGDDNQNNNSIGIVVQYGAFSAIFTGDAEEPELQLWRLMYRLGAVKLLKASHHGSMNGINSDWATLMSPRVVVISVGANNPYGHPSTEAMLAWSATGSLVYRTDAVGTVTVSAAEDGGMSVTTSSGLMNWVVR